jgi:hypothetical protein
MKRNVKIPFEFYCLTDLPESKFQFDEVLPNGEINEHRINTMEIISHWPGYWSKIELFKLSGPLFYMDLDMVIVSDITAGLTKLMADKNIQIAMVSDYRTVIGYPHRWSSAMMFWNDKLDFVFNEFEIGLAGMYWGDQAYIQDSLEKHGVPISKMQDYINSISYKWQVVQSGIPRSGVSVIGFHGKPMPHEVIPPPTFLRRCWI